MKKESINKEEKIMKYVAERGYKDLVLNRHVDAGEVLEDIYLKENKELTEERLKYLVEERKLYIAIEEIVEGEIKEITLVDNVPAGEVVIDRVDIVEDNKENIIDKTDDEKIENYSNRDKKARTKSDKK